MKLLPLSAPFVYIITFGTPTVSAFFFRHPGKYHKFFTSTTPKLISDEL